MIIFCLTEQVFFHLEEQAPVQTQSLLYIVICLLSYFFFFSIAIELFFVCLFFFALENPNALTLAQMLCTESPWDWMPHMQSKKN